MPYSEILKQAPELSNTFNDIESSSNSKNSLMASTCKEENFLSENRSQDFHQHKYLLSRERSQESERKLIPFYGVAVKAPCCNQDDSSRGNCYLGRKRKVVRCARTEFQSSFGSMPFDIYAASREGKTKCES